MLCVDSLIDNFLRRSGPAQVGSAILLACLAPVAWSGVPILNSDYRAPHVLYLDFGKHEEDASPYFCEGTGSPEGWPLGFTVSDITADMEDDEVRQIWEAVAEDFAPFNVNVTTDPQYEPAPGQANAVRVAIGVSSQPGLGTAPAICYADHLANPAYLNARISNVVVVGLDPRSDFNPREAAKRISHEAGHLYGLAHHLAAAGLADDWIMAPQRSARRYIWREGADECGHQQHDVDHLAALLGRRTDEPQPAQLRTAWSVSHPPIGYAKGTLEQAGDSDEFTFSPTSIGSLEVRLWPGIWTNVWKPAAGAEANARYLFSIVSGDGQTTLACPESNVLRMSVSEQETSGYDCAIDPLVLSLGTTYRIRVYRSMMTYLAGNLGRYTVIVQDPTVVPIVREREPWPPELMWISH